MASYRLELSRSAERDLRKIDRQRLPAIFDAIATLAANPLPNGVRKLSGFENSYRIRVGDYRVVYEIEHDVLLVLVVRVRHRRDVYR